jgi:hypothetical protein
MRVFKVNPDVNHYQKFFLEDRDRVERWTEDPLLQFNCDSLADRWQVPEVFILHPKLKVPDFWSFEIPGVELVTTSRVIDLMSTIFTIAGELLEVRHAGNTLYLFNVLECLNCLDGKNSLIPGRPNPELRPYRYVFHRGRFSDATLFKIPDDRFTCTFAIEDEGDPETEFKAAVEHHGLQGLDFKLLWDSED